MADKFLGTLRVDLAAFTAGFDKNLDKAAGKLARFGRRTERQLKQAGTALTASVTLPLVAAGGSAIVASQKIEAASRKIQVATGATDEQMVSLGETMRRIAKETPESFDVIAGAMGSLQTQTGETGESLEGLTRTILAGSRLLEEDAVGAAEGVGRLVKQFGLDAEGGAQIYAKLFENAQKYDVAVEKQLRNLRVYGPVLTNANVSLEEQADLMARLESAGLDVSRVMPGINMAVRRFADNNLDARDALEVSFEAIANAKTEMEGLSVATEIFGSEGAARLTRAVRDGTISFEDLGAAAEKTAQDIIDFEEENRLPSERLAKLWNNVSVAIAPIGDRLVGILERLEPYILRAVSYIDAAVVSFDSLDPKMQLAIAGVVGLTAALGPMLLAAGFAIGALRSMGLLALNAARGLAKLATVTLTRVVPAMKAATVAALKMAAAVGSVVVAAAGGFLLGTYLAEEVEAFERFGIEAVTAVDTLWIEIQRAWHTGVAELKIITRRGLVAVLETVADFGPQVADKVADVIENVSPSIANKVRGMAAAASAVGTFATAQVGVGTDKIREDLEKKTEELDDQLDIVAQVLESRLAEIEAKYADPNRVQGAAFKSRLESYLDPIRDFLSGAISGVDSGDVDEKIRQIDDATKDLLDSAAGGLPDVAAAAGDLSLTIDDILGKATGPEAEKAAAAVDDFQGRMLDAIEGWSSEVSGVFTDFLLDGEATFDQLAESFVRMLTRMLMQELVFAPIFAAIRGGLGLAPQAHGGVWSSGVQVEPFAAGGVVTRPTLFPTSTPGSVGLMGEAGPEAILPLGRMSGGDLGVKAMVGGETTVNVYDQRSGGAPVGVRESRGPGGSRRIELFIRDAVRDALASGELDRTMSASYGINRRSGSR